MENRAELFTCISVRSVYASSVRAHCADRTRSITCAFSYLSSRKDLGKTFCNEVILQESMPILGLGCRYERAAALSWMQGKAILSTFYEASKSSLKNGHSPLR